MALNHMDRDQFEEMMAREADADRWDAIRSEREQLEKAQDYLMRGQVWSHVGLDDVIERLSTMVGRATGENEFGEYVGQVRVSGTMMQRHVDPYGADDTRITYHRCIFTFFVFGGQICTVADTNAAILIPQLSNEAWMMGLYEALRLLRSEGRIRLEISTPVKVQGVVTPVKWDDINELGKRGMMQYNLAGDEMTFDDEKYLKALERDYPPVRENARLVRGKVKAAMRDIRKWKRMSQRFQGYQNEIADDDAIPF